MKTRQLVFLLLSTIYTFALIAQSYRWQPANGPFGCDATSFFIDKKGNYWLGTGSSGGVYFSKNKGKIWEARNDGIGPVHVAQINEINDTLYIQVSDNNFNRDGDISFYFWQPKNRKWKLIQNMEIRSKDLRATYKFLAKAYKGQNLDSIFSGDTLMVYYVKNSDKLTEPVMLYDTVYSTYIKWLADTMNAMAQRQSEKIQEQFPFDLSGKNGTWYSYTDHLAGDWGVYPYTVSWGTGLGGVWEGRTVSHITGFKDSLGNLGNINPAFPRDMFLLPAGNIFNTQDNSKILLAKSGIYRLKKNKISPLSVKGLCATDIRQILCIGSRLVVLAGESDIWEYSNNQWRKLFNAWEHHKLSGSWYSIGGFDTRQLNALPDGRILFCFCGDIWQISKEGIASELFAQPAFPQQVNVENALTCLNSMTTPDSIPCKVRLYFTGAGQDNNGTYWAVANWMPDESNYYRQVLVKITPAGSPFILVKLLEETSSGGNAVYCFIFNDKAGGVWLRSGKEIKQIGSDADTSLTIPAYSNQWLNSVAFQNDGSFSYLNKYYDSILYHYNHNLKVIEQVSIPRLENMVCIGYDKNNHLWAGTGKEYSFTCGNRMYGEARGLFKLENGKWKCIPGEPNKWILSVGSGFSGEELPVGTSGSGLWFIKYTDTF